MRSSLFYLLLGAATAIVMSASTGTTLRQSLGGALFFGLVSLAIGKNMEAGDRARREQLVRENYHAMMHWQYLYELGIPDYDISPSVVEYVRECPDYSATWMNGCELPYDENTTYLDRLPAGLRRENL